MSGLSEKCGLWQDEQRLLSALWICVLFSRCFPILAIMVSSSRFISLLWQSKHSSLLLLTKRRLILEPCGVWHDWQAPVSNDGLWTTVAFSFLATNLS